VVRSHYGQDARADGEKIYRAGNAIAEWLGLYSWADIPRMQQPASIAAFRLLLKNAQ
jgi:hypothetical protein